MNDGVVLHITALDVKREVKRHKFLMRTRREGGTASDGGFVIGRQRLIFTNPVSQVQAWQHVSLVVCREG